jgi:mannitol/fructose-specific phosphotransferase system IIA component (Ntr-type)
MKLASILNPELIFTGLQGTSREEIYTEMARRASEIVNFSTSPEQICSQMIDRETLVGIPYEGMAIPHLRLPELRDLFVAIGIMAEPVQLKDNDIKPTQVIVMSFISDNTSDVYLKALAAFTKYFMDPAHLENTAKSTTPEIFLQQLIADNVTLKKNITAEDVMMKEFAFVKPEDHLSEAVDLFVTRQVEVMPVVDDAGKLLGVMSATKLVRDFMPDYIMMMDNLDFLNSFEPFEKIFQQEETRFVKDHMRDPILVVKTDTPLIQFTVKLIRGDAHAAIVIDDNRKVLGVISIKSIIHKVLRG